MLKSLYISLYIGASIAGLAASLWGMSAEGPASSWLGAAIACAGPVAFFATVFSMPIARTSSNLPWVLASGLAGTALSLVLGGGPPLLLAFAVGIAGNLLYVRWYSRFDDASGTPLRVGNVLPELPFVEGGRERTSRELVGRPALWIFYRGNWCPLCVAQIREICEQYREIARRGIEVFLVSPQPEQHSRELASRCDAPMRYLTDRDNRAAERLGIAVRDGIPAGLQALGYDSDTTRPAVFITDANGVIAYCDLTDNYRVRPEPSQYWPVLEQVAAS